MLRMNTQVRRIRHYLKKYTPDLLVNAGVFLFAVNFFEKEVRLRVCIEYIADCYHDEKEWGLIVATMLIAVGINVLVRRYWIK